MKISDFFSLFKVLLIGINKSLWFNLKNMKYKKKIKKTRLLKQNLIDFN